MKNAVILFSIAAGMAMINSCAKEGLGGEVVLEVRPTHHGAAILSTAAYKDSVFIKFNTLEAPQDPIHDYDALFVGEVGDPHVHVDGLKWGEYYIYCTGWDTAISDRVVGGIPLTIKRKQRKDEIDVEVPVVE